MRSVRDHSFFSIILQKYFCKAPEFSHSKQAIAPDFPHHSIQEQQVILPTQQCISMHWARLQRRVYNKTLPTEREPAILVILSRYPYDVNPLTKGVNAPNYSLMTSSLLTKYLVYNCFFSF